MTQPPRPHQHPQPPTTPAAAQNDTRNLLPRPPPLWHLSKRAAGRGTGYDGGYDGDSSQSASPDTASMTPPSTAAAAERGEALDPVAAAGGRSGVDKNAALLLMHLSVRDSVPGEEEGGVRREKETQNAGRAHDRISSVDMAVAAASPAEGRTALSNAALSGPGASWYGDRHSRKRRRASSM